MTIATVAADKKEVPKRVSLLRVLGPGHVWAVGSPGTELEFAL